MEDHYRKKMKAIFILVCKDKGMDPDEVYSKNDSQKQEYVELRFISMYFFGMFIDGLCFQDMADFFEMKTHSNAIHAVKTVGNWIKFNKIFRARIENLESRIRLAMKKYSNEKYKEGTFKFGRCTVIVSLDGGVWHMSISTPSASPNYRELKEARYKYLPDDITVAQLFPPLDEFVNLHPYCHHLWEINNDRG